MILRSIFFLLLGCSIVQGTRFAPPEKDEVFSLNGKFYVKIDPDSETHQVFSIEDLEPIWEFQRKVWHEEYFIANDGQSVVLVAWPFVSEPNLDKPAIIVYRADGKADNLAYNAVSTPRKYHPGEVGPLGDRWRIWRKGAEVQKTDLVIEVEGGKAVRISLE